MTTADKLREAKALIEDPARWCQETFAKDKNGDGVSATSTRAVRWCAIGACRAVEASEGFLYKATQWESIAKLNDRKGHKAVMQMFDRAIELAEEAE